MSHPAKMEEEDYGVPSDMQDGEVDEEEWVRWRMLDSEVTVDQINELVANYVNPGSGTYSSSFSLPPLYTAYLSSRYVLNVYLRYEGFTIELPNLPSDYPLRELRNLWSSSELLIKGDIFHLPPMKIMRGLSAGIRVNQMMTMIMLSCGSITIY